MTTDRTGSWQIAGGEARFELAGDLEERRECVAQLGFDCKDDDDLEGYLIRAQLASPEAAALRRIDLSLTDFHRSARVALAALTARPRPALAELRLALRGFSCERAEGDGFVTSSGSSLSAPDPWDSRPALDVAAPCPLVPRDLVRKLASAAPQLSALILVGDGWFEALYHPALRTLHVSGLKPVPVRALELAALTRFDAYVDATAGIPLESLGWDFRGMPALERLGLLGPNIEEAFAWLADDKVLSRLRVLEVDSVAGGDLRTLERYADRFRHLRLVVHAEEDAAACRPFFAAVDVIP